jgi:hypothetical protein
VNEERQRWGGPSPWAGRDSRTDAQKKEGESVTAYSGRKYLIGEELVGQRVWDAFRELRRAGESMKNTTANLTPHQKALEEALLHRNELELKVTVVSTPGGPDGVLAKMDLEKVRLTASPYTLTVVKIERADGQPFGMDSEFEEYWEEVSCAGDGEDETAEKASARSAFRYGVSWGREHA